MSDMMEIIEARHSVRQYTDKKIPKDIRGQLDEYVEKLNQEGNLKLQIIYDEPLNGSNVL